MIECCGKTRTSMFCPDCGVSLSEDPSVTLLNYLVKQQNSQRKQLDNWGLGASQIKRKEKVLQKWKDWATELERLIALSIGL